MPAPSTDRKGAARVASATWAWVGAVLTIGYLLPWAIAASRGAPNSAQIFWLNLLLGWTLIGWVVALVMALGRHHQIGPAVIVHQAAPAYGQAYVSGQTGTASDAPAPQHPTQQYPPQH